MAQATVPANDHAPRASLGRRAWPLALAAIALSMIVVTWWAVAPGPDRFRRFDAAQLGRAEAGLWRDYYEHDYSGLAAGLVLSDRRAFGLSPWDSLNSGIDAALAAKAFQGTHSRAEAQAALPALTRHFAMLARATHARFDPATAARLELNWWQLRRETHSGPDAYAPAIAAATGYLYGLPPERLATYARLRAAAMDLRDRKDAHITNADWARISALLEEAYAALRVETAPHG